MKRREFIAGLVGAAVAAWPAVARAQQSKIPVIGYLGSSSLEASSSQLIGFQQGLAELSLIEDKSVALQYRWSDGQNDRLPGMASDLAERKVAVILASGLPAALAARGASTTIPIVFVMGADPVASGMVPRLNRPGSNITGVSQFYGSLGGKRLELLQEIVPGAVTIAVLTNPNNPNSQAHLTDVEAVAKSTARKLNIIAARGLAEIDAAFARFERERPDALLVADDPNFTVNRKHLVGLAEKLRLPAIYYTREYADDGGLFTYGSSTTDNYRLAAGYVGRIILQGVKPADLPVLQPTKFELVINLKTANALGITIPPTLLARSDEVVE